MKIRHVTGVLIAALAASGAQALTIDSFVTESAIVVYGGDSNTDVAPAGAIGDRTLTMAGNPRFEYTSIEQSPYFYWDFASGPSDLSAVAILSYSKSGGLNLDLTGFQSIVAPVKHYDQLIGTSTLDVTLFSNDGAQNALLSKSFGKSAEGTDLLFALSLFSGVDLGDIDKIEFKLTGFPSADIQIGALSVAPVPLPAALPMLLAGLGGLVVIARRRAA